MLDALRTATKGLVGRSLMTIVLGLIIVSFAVWGIGDIFRGFGSDKLAQVGKTEIGVDAYRDAYQGELQRLQRQARRAITNDEARRYGIDRQVLSRLVSNATLDQEAQILGLALSDQDITKRIAGDAMFKGITGQFDRQKLEAILRDNGLTEKVYIAEQRGQALRGQVTDALTHALQTPQAMLAAIHRFQAETRSVDYLVLPVSSAGALPEPSQDDLKKYFEDRQENYGIPEYRSFVTLAVTPSALAKPDDVSDADARKRYDEIKTERFGTPEKRAVEQILLADVAAANEARASLGSGKTFDQLLASRNLTPKDASLGTLAHDSFADKNVADAAFALAQGSVSAPIVTPFGTVLVRVTEIVASTLKPFSDVAPDLKREIALQRARADVGRLHDRIEDQRASGKSLVEVTQELGLAPSTVEAIDAAGNDPQGKPVPDFSTNASLMKAVFASDVGVDNETLRTRDGGYEWFEIVKITPARQNDFDDVKAEVEKAWRDDETSKHLSAKAAELAKKIEAGEAVAAIAAAEGNLEVKHATDVKRTGSETLALKAVAQIFNVGVKGAGSVQLDDGTRILFQVVDAKVPALDLADPSLTALATQVRTGILDDVLGQYLTKLQNDLGVKVNSRAFAAATGASPDAY